MTRGQFIVFEGGDGTGKSTQVKALAEGLARHGIEVALTREPGGSKGAEDIRALFVKGATDRWTPKSEILLITAARVDHLERFILPKLEAGISVICDRFFDTSIAYQGYGHGLPLDLIERLHADFCDNIGPDLTILLDAPIEKTLARSKARLQAETSGEDRFEGFSLDFHRRLAQAFRDRVAAAPERYLVADALAAPEAISETILEGVLQRLFQAAAA